MNFSSFKLVFLGKNEGTHPVARVQVGQTTSKMYGGTSVEDLLTHECASVNEFDHEIRRLHDEMDDIQKKAHKKFAEDRAKPLVVSDDDWKSPEKS